MLRVCGFRMASVKSLLILWSEVCCNTFLSLSLSFSLSLSQTNLLTPSISYSDTHSDENTHTRTTTSTPLSHFLHSHKHSLSPLVSTSLCLNTAFFLSLRCLQYHSISLSLTLSFLFLSPTFARDARSGSRFVREQKSKSAQL